MNDKSMITLTTNNNNAMINAMIILVADPIGQLGSARAGDLVRSQSKVNSRSSSDIPK